MQSTIESLLHVLTDVSNYDKHYIYTEIQSSTKDLHLIRINVVFVIIRSFKSFANSKANTIPLMVKLDRRNPIQ